jgi:hypothetical protein
MYIIQGAYTDLFLIIIKLLPLVAEEFAQFACAQVRKPSAQVHEAQRREKDVPKLASGFSCFILSRQSWLKYMYAERARLGAFGSFLREPREAFSDLAAALRVWAG